HERGGVGAGSSSSSPVCVYVYRVRHRGPSARLREQDSAMQKTAHRLAAPTAAAALALGAALVSATPAAGAAAPEPLRCERVGAVAEDPAIATVARLLGIAVEDVSGPVGVSCTDARDGDAAVNFCATRNYGVLAVGHRPEGHRCR
ncbi:hydrophobin family protein, partial [Streptomyces clavuligerus]